MTTSLNFHNENPTAYPARLIPHLESALRHAAYEGNDKEVNLLLNLQVSPCAKGPGGKTAIHLAAMAGHLHILQKFCNNISYELLNSLDENLQSPLHLATRRAHCACIGLLLNKGADANIKDIFQRTAFSIAPNDDIRNIFNQHYLKNH